MSSPVSLDRTTSCLLSPNDKEKKRGQAESATCLSFIILHSSLDFDAVLAPRQYG